MCQGANRPGLVNQLRRLKQGKHPFSSPTTRDLRVGVLMRPSVGQMEWLGDQTVDQSEDPSLLLHHLKHWLGMA
eukprot:10947370-Prorocentrum_lima.AAC.1